LLVAMPNMADPTFNRTVAYVCEHNENGALGIIINRPMNMDIRAVLDQMSLEIIPADLLEQPVLRGGPVQENRGFVLHQTQSKWDATTTVGASIFVTTSQDILVDLAAGRGPDRLVIALGYSGWGPGQLEEEILQNAWLTVPALPELIFDTPYEQRWKAAALSIGIDPVQLGPQAGHA
jgi:putative transcriptional regulator